MMIYIFSPDTPLNRHGGREGLERNGRKTILFR